MKILILGFSKSGRASYELLKDNNQVYIYDKKKLKVDNYYSFTKLKKELPFFDLVIRSPGIKQTSKVYQLALILSKKTGKASAFQNHRQPICCLSTVPAGWKRPAKPWTS